MVSEEIPTGRRLRQELAGSASTVFSGPSEPGASVLRTSREGVRERLQVRQVGARLANASRPRTCAHLNPNIQTTADWPEMLVAIASLGAVAYETTVEVVRTRHGPPVRDYAGGP